MHLYEHEGKELFNHFKIPTPKGTIVTSTRGLNKKLKHLNKSIVLKAQLLHGHRGKQGLIQFTTKDKAKKEIKKLLKKCSSILIEEKLKIKKEFYLSITINQSKSSYTLLFSKSGGVDIEEVPKKDIKAIHFKTFNKTKVNKHIKNSKITAVAEKLFHMMQRKDATLVEINPLIQTKDNKFLAADAKVTIDQNALYRQREFQEMRGREKTKLEKKAEHYRLHYVELKGNIAVIGNGAGLTMATLDTLNHHNLKPANFLDAAGGTTKHAMIQSMKIALAKRGIKALFINMFGGITETDKVAEGIGKYIKKHKPRKPIIIRMYGTNYKKAHQILKKYKISAHTNIKSALKELEQI